LEAREYLDSVDLPERYLVCLGRVNVRKNIGAVLGGAFCSRIISEDIPLVLVGPQDDRQEEGVDELLSALGTRVRCLGYVADEVVNRILHRATALISLTQVEGFGLPPLEAMAMGVPVIAAVGETAREVLGDAPYWIEDVKCAQVVADAIDRVMAEEGLREGMRVKGLGVAASYSWERSGQALSEAIDTAVVSRRSS